MTDERMPDEPTASELELGLRTLGYLRESLLRKAAGLSDEQARWSPVPTGTSIGGLIQHVTFAQSFWCEFMFAGGELPPGITRTMELAPDATLRALRRQYRAAGDRCDTILREVGDLDALTARARDGRRFSARWVLVHLVEEVARHAGHADIIRELVDGRTGR